MALHCPAIVLVQEAAAGRPVRYVSDSIRQLGFEPDDFISGKLGFESLIHPLDRERIVSETDKHLQSSLLSFDQQYRVLTDSGELRWVRSCSAVVRNEHGALVSLQTTIIDVTQLVIEAEYCRDILDLSSNLFLVLDAGGRLKDFNQRAVELTGASPEELMGCVWVEEFVSEEHRARFRNRIAQAGSTVGDGGPEYESEMVARNGNRRTILWHFDVRQSPQDSGSEIIAFGHDVTAERKTSTRAAMFASLSLENPSPVLRIDRSGDIILANDAAQKLMGSLTDSTTHDFNAFQKLIKNAAGAESSFQREIVFSNSSYLFQVEPVLNERYSNLYAIDISEQEALTLRLRQITDNMPGAVFRYIRNEGGPDSIEFANYGCADIFEYSAEELHRDPSLLWSSVHPDDLEQMKDSVSESANKLTEWQQDWRIVTRSGVTKWLRGRGTPTRQHDGSIAWITIVIDQTQLKKLERAVSTSLEKTIFVLSAALEKRDPYTAGHEERVTRIAKLIAKEMGLDSFRVQGLQFAAMVHDVGKIAVPAEILSKPGKLTDTEFALIKAHPDVGADLLKDIEFDWPIADIIRQHHERIDGSGYPQGLKGEEILLEARIIAVADVLEAMASHRPYRHGLGIEKAAEEIRQGAGIRYDADVAAACLKLVAESRIQIPV